MVDKPILEIGEGCKFYRLLKQLRQKINKMAKILNRALKLCGQEQKIGTYSIQILEFDVNGMVMRAQGINVPANGDVGFAKSCLFVKTDAGAGTKGLYENQGTTTSCSFNLIGAIDTAEIADAAVTTAKIADLNVTTGKLAANAVETVKILDANVTTAKIADAAITQPKVKTKAVVALADADATLTATQMVDSGIFTITPTVARTLTTDTAANLVAAMTGYQVGTWFEFTIVCLAAFAVTLAAGTGVTIVGDAVANNVSATFKARIDSATAVTIYRL